MDGIVHLQSFQVDLLAKSEICNGAAVVCDTAGITPLGGVWGHASTGNFEKMEVAKTCFPSF